MLFRSLAVTTRQKGIQALVCPASHLSTGWPVLLFLFLFLFLFVQTSTAQQSPTSSTTLLHPPSDPPTRHTLNCLVQNEPGVLSRVSGILAARNFNIDSLVVAKTERQNQNIEQAKKQLEDLVPVWAVLDYSNTRIVERELLLVKVSIFGPTTNRLSLRMTLTAILT
ncbi:acetolactate synthase [Basidiobolus meristosporus CBS 931.73]|uniref:Acetolactate synthase small subunit n=1 Tax=Basidiobolus meristosporus CBS 931.73 TaxID=1314790 RepID=A0A1Y1XSL7_9FUNG|nr:acetolactate synthase [Basidiobolus meristosporus CBS 931.73]|eukprot:ORX88728.1 acetolactate synthase [Basidiobolus meristosporus CBS 931.73]